MIKDENVENDERKDKGNAKTPKQAEGFQHIGCNVTNCAHNSLETCTCRLDHIHVCPCSLNGDGTPERETACGSFKNVGNENMYSSRSY